MMRKSILAGKRAHVLPLLCVGLIQFNALTPVLAQQEGPAGPPEGVSMSIFPVNRGADGVQYITTRAGFKVTVPGLGIAPDANEIAVYRNMQNQFWYVDKSGVTQPVSASQIQWTEAQINNQQALRTIQAQASMNTNPPGSEMTPMGAIPQGAMPQMQYPQQGQYAQPQTVVNNYTQAPQQSQSSGGSAVVSGLAAAGGAMAGSIAGAAISDSMYDGNYHGIPYGAACYAANGHSYYNAADGAHEIPMHTDNPYVNQWSRQQAYQNNSENRQNAYNNLNGNQQQMLKNKGMEGLQNRQEHPAEDRFGGLRGLGGRFRR